MPSWIMKRCSSGCAAAKRTKSRRISAQARGEVDALETGEARAERLAEQREIRSAAARQSASFVVK